MSESRTSLEQILELLLAEDTERAEELLHEYVVSKARAEYERVLDEAEEDEFDIDHGDPAGDLEDEISDHEDEIASDEEGDSSAELDFDSEDEESDDEEVEDKIDDLEKEIEDLRAELESMIADQEMGAADADADADLDLDMDMDMDADAMDMDLDMDAEGDDELLDSVEYDLDEEELEEATQFSDKVADPKAGEADAGAGKSPYTDAPKHTVVSSQGEPVRAKDGAEGKKDHGQGVKDQNPTDRNIDVDHKKGPAAKDGKAHQDGSNKASPLTKAPK